MLIKKPKPQPMKYKLQFRSEYSPMPWEEYMNELVKLLALEMEAIALNKLNEVGYIQEWE